MAMTSKSLNYALYAWRDNRIRLKVTQGEYGIKLAQFTLMDDSGAINLSTATAILFNGIKRNGTGFSVDCSVVNVTKGTIAVQEEIEMTDIHGDAQCAIEVISDNGVVKFDGITLCVSPNEIGELITASESFKSLETALNKVALLTPEGTIALDDELTDDSVNAVQGKVIKEALDSKADTDDVYTVEEADSHFLSADEPSGSVQTQHIVDSAITTAKLSEDVQTSITSKAKASLFLQQSASQLIKLTDIDTVINGLQIAIKNNHIKLKGTATANITSWISADVRVETYKSGVTYTGSAQNVKDYELESGNTQSAIGIRFHYSANGHMPIGNTDKSISFTPSSNISGDTARLAWNISAGEYDKEFDLMLEYGSTMTTFEPYYVVSNIGNHSVTYNKLNEDIQKEINSISGKAESSDLKSKISHFEFIDITTTETGYYYSLFAHNTDGNWECTATPIPCKEGDIFRFSASMYDIDNHQHTVKCYDSSQKLVGSYCGVIEEGKSAHYNNKIFVVPEGVAYVAFNCWIAMSGVRLKVEKAVPVIDLTTQIANGLFDETPSKILYGKSLYSDGDSIADGAGSNGVSYAHLLRDKYNMTLTDESVGGTTIAVQDGRTDSIYERITSMSGDYDYILFEGGTNDVSLSIRLGEITDGVNAEFDTTTVLGALEGICQFLNTTYFDAQKLFIFVNKRVDVTFNKTNETFAKMKEVLKKWGIPYIDIGNVTNLGNWNDTVASDYFLADKLHPTLKAYKKFYLPYVEKALTFGGYINT